MRYFLALFIFVISCALADEVIFQTDSETDIKDKIDPNPELIEFVLKNEPEDVGLFEECLKENNLKRNEAKKLFSVARISLISGSNAGYFIRPAIEPWCMAFYGAHLFRYWFVSSKQVDGRETYEMVYKSGGDGIKVLGSTTNGLHDLITESHTALELYKVKLKYSGNEYKIDSCLQDTFEDGKVVSTKPCREFW